MARKFKPKRAAQSASPATAPVISKPEKRHSIWAERLALLSIMALFFASGFCGLIYQVAWSRISVLVFGATTFATATVLAIFMGGLALGSYLAGKRADALAKPLLVYGILEAIVGVWSVLTPSMFNAVTPLYKQVWIVTGGAGSLFMLMRVLCTAAILLVPTTCMGATLPVLSKYIGKSLKLIGDRIGLLYSINTLGAIAGAFASGFMLLPIVGTSGTINVAAGINGLLLLGALFLQWSLGRAGEALGTAEHSSTARSGVSLPSPRVAIIAFACSGAVAMIYEVCWTRTLLMVVGSSTYAFTVMLGAFLTGIFGGSLLCSRFVDRTESPLKWFAALQVLLCAFTLLSMYLFNYLPFWNLVLNSTGELSADGVMLVRFLLSSAVLVPITFCLGAIFPAAVKACTHEVEHVGNSVGTLYAANTLGAIVGSVLAGFALIPLIGVEKSLLIGAAANAAIGLYIWCSSVLGSTSATPRATPRGWATPTMVASAAPLALVAVATLVILQIPGLWNRDVLLSAQGVRRNLSHHELRYKTYEDWAKSLTDYDEVKFYRDGACSNVGVVFHKSTKVQSLLTNGHVDASDGDDVPVQTLIPAFSLLMKPDAQDVAIIGWGCGQTAGTTSLFPVKHIDAIELEPAVIEASHLFHAMNHAPEKDPRVELIYNDGRNFMLATDKKYDIIMSEPSNPWQAGVCNLFTKEYFDLCSSRLNHGGVLSLWIQTAEIPPRDLCAVLAALNKSFKYSMALRPLRANIVVLASNEPLKIQAQKTSAAIASQKVSAELAHVGIRSLGDYLGHIVVAADGMKSLVSSALVNTDDQNHLEFDVAKSYEDRVFIRENDDLLCSLAGNPWEQVDWQGVDSATKAEAMSEAADSAVQFCSDDQVLAWIKNSVAVKPSAHAYKTAGGIYAREKKLALADAQFSKALELNPNDADVLMLRGATRVGMEQRESGRVDLQKALAMKPDDKMTRYMLASSYATQLTGQPFRKEELAAHKDAVATQTLQILGKIPDDTQFADQHPNAYFVAAQAYYKLGNFPRARKYLESFLVVKPDSAEGQNFARVLAAFEK